MSVKSLLFAKEKNLTLQIYSGTGSPHTDSIVRYLPLYTIGTYFHLSFSVNGHMIIFLLRTHTPTARTQKSAKLFCISKYLQAKYICWHYVCLHINLHCTFLTSQNWTDLPSKLQAIIYEKQIKNVINNSHFTFTGKAQYVQSPQIPCISLESGGQTYSG